MGTHTGPISHGAEAATALWEHTLNQYHTGRGQQQHYGNIYWTNIPLGGGSNSAMGTHTGPTSHWAEAATALWEHTLDQHHTGRRQQQLYGKTHWTNITLGGGSNSAMGTHTGPTSHWAEAATAPWEHTLDQYHTVVEEVEVQGR